MNAWGYLAIGILFEVVGTSMLKVSNGFSETIPTIVCLVCFCVALTALSLSVKTLDISIVYAIWSGAGVVLISLIGVFFFKEQLSFLAVVFITLILIGVVGLNIISGEREVSASTKQESN